MKENSYAYVILGALILIGSIIVGLVVPEEKEEYNIVTTIGSSKYEAIVYSNNTIKVYYQKCMSNNCYVENEKYTYSKDEMNNFRTLIKQYNFETYDEERTYTTLIYDVKTNKVIYEIDDKLNDLINKLLLNK